MAWVSGQVQREQNDESSLSDSGFLIKPIDNMFVWIHFGSAYMVGILQKKGYF